MHYINQQTWENLDQSLKNDGRVPVIFGANVMAALFFMRFPGVKEFYVIDNDKKKHGHCLDEYAFGINSSSEIYKKIGNKNEVFPRLNRDNAVIVINGTKRYKEMYEASVKAGFKHIYITVIMETHDATIVRGNEEDYFEALYKYFAEECAKLPIEDKKILVYTEGYYGDHGKAIINALLKLDQSYNITWALKDSKDSLPKAYKKVPISNTLQYIKEFETARVVIYSSELPITFTKRPEQIYFQTTHWSSVTLKTFGLDFYKFHNLKYGILRCIHDRDAIDYLFTGSDFDERTFRKAFGYAGKSIRVGSPRSDILFDTVGIRERICKKLGLNVENKYLLYAPTFRANLENGYIQKAYGGILDYDMLIDVLSKKFGGTWKVMLRFHPDIGNKIQSDSLPDNIINVTDYPDVQELIVLSDVVMTDYSSLMFEPAYAYKPVFLYAPDRNDYINRDRPLLIPYDELPFPIAVSTKELRCLIQNFDEKDYKVAVSKFFNKHGVHEDGHASERAARAMMRIMRGKR